MNNYQLTKTNVLLGGQMKWNLQVKSDMNDNLEIEDFFLSPISPGINYVKPDRDVLNYTHHENIKDLYDTIKADFYELNIDQKFSIKLPIISENPKEINTYCNIFDMGASRISSSKMGKSLQIFCPLWLEDFKEDDVLQFNISIFNEKNNRNDVYNDVEINKTLTFSNSKKDYHNKFLQYFKNYLKDIYDKGNIGDKVININLDNTYMAIEGIDVKTGNKIVKNISYSLPNIISSFRPMMDTDSLIINNFKDNNMICKQLFNFNLIFDIEDILTNKMIKQITSSKFKFSITTNIIRNDEIIQLPIKSFSFNYDENYKIPGGYPYKKTLDFFQDYNYIHLIDKNKIAPNIIHWSSTYDNDYVFNIYPDAVLNTNMYGTNSQNDNLCLHWCNNDLLYEYDTSYTYMINNQKALAVNDNLLNMISKDLDIYSKFKGGKNFANNIFYDNTENAILYVYINIIDDLIDKARLEYIANDETRNLLKFNNNYNEHIGYIYKRDGLSNYYNILIDTKYINDISFKNFQNNIKNYTGYNDDIKNLSKILDSNKKSKIIPINSSIVITPYESPVTSINKNDKTITKISKEINYGKISIPEHYMFRQDGYIKPCFVDFNENNYYMIKKLDDIKEWDNFIKTNFQPLYPSIDYFYLQRINKNDYEIECNWYNDSELYILPTNLTFNIIKDITKNKQSITDDIKSYLKNYYYINGYVFDYIYNLYNYDIEFDYLDKNNINIYKYTIHAKLK